MSLGEHAGQRVNSSRLKFTIALPSVDLSFDLEVVGVVDTNGPTVG